MSFFLSRLNLSYPAPLSTIFILLVALGLTTSCEKQADNLVVLAGQTMGTTYSIRIVANPFAGINHSELENEIGILLEKQNQLFSTYRQDSLVSRFNRSVSDQWFKITPEFLRVLLKSKELYQLSKGAFDTSSAGLIEIWGFGTKTRLSIPDNNKINTILLQTGLDLVEIDETRLSIKKNNPRLQLDFSAIAKGYAVDQIHRYLLSQNLDHHLIELGGEVYASGLNSSGDSWRVRIDKAPSTHPLNTIVLHNAGIATSGDYRNYFHFEGKKYAHLIDPRTGYPIQNDLISATIISDTTMNADGLATTLMVFGKEAAIQLCQEQGIQAYLVFRDEKTGTEQVWTNFKQQ